jgi:hypothetical protein
MENRGKVWFLAAVSPICVGRSLVSPGRVARFNIRLGPHWRCLLLAIFTAYLRPLGMQLRHQKYHKPENTCTK